MQHCCAPFSHIKQVNNETLLRLLFVCLTLRLLLQMMIVLPKMMTRNDEYS